MLVKLALQVLFECAAAGPLKPHFLEGSNRLQPRKLQRGPTRALNPQQLNTSYISDSCLLVGGANKFKDVKFEPNELALIINANTELTILNWLDTETIHGPIGTMN
jgi:hypothetical protein